MMMVIVSHNTWNMQHHFHQVQDLFQVMIHQEAALIFLLLSTLILGCDSNGGNGGKMADGVCDLINFIPECNFDTKGCTALIAAMANCQLDASCPKSYPSPAPAPSPASQNSVSISSGSSSTSSSSTSVSSEPSVFQQMVNFFAENPARLLLLTVLPLIFQPVLSGLNVIARRWDYVIERSQYEYDMFLYNLHQAREKYGI